ncbi:unnamed protein product [Prorocentrum cordatum]|uniref:Eukaryotic translation initiation factor 3 30 kDa subunit n=1 Tax=Prorocentrum cordatum TaxID=2364126 RepID=A0ABN9VEG0_9DINO|nr:unnamed protein product [Polarella glacialis]
MLGRLALALAAAGARPAAADHVHLPPAFARLYPAGHTAGAQSRELILGMREIFDVAKLWHEGELAGDAEGVEGKRKKCEVIYQDLAKAADYPHDVFSGLRLFATTMKKAADSSDVAAMDKALGMRHKFSKALERIAGKVEAAKEQVRILHKKKMEKAKKAAEAAAARGDDGVAFDDDGVDEDEDLPDVGDEDNRDEF